MLGKKRIGGGRERNRKSGETSIERELLSDGYNASGDGPHVRAYVLVCLCARDSMCESLSVPCWVGGWTRQIHGVRGGGAGVPAPAGPDTRQLAALQHAGSRSAIRV